MQREPAKMAEPIVMPFEMWTGGTQRTDIGALGARLWVTTCIFTKILVTRSQAAIQR